MKRDVNSRLSAFLGLSESIGARLQEGTTDDVVALLQERGDLLSRLQEDSFVTDLKFALGQGGAATELPGISSIRLCKLINKIWRISNGNWNTLSV